MSPSSRRRAAVNVNASRIGWGEDSLAEALRVRGLNVKQQEQVRPYLIDLACWPVAYEVWSGSAYPSRSIATQRLRTVALISRGWTVCYVKVYARYRGRGFHEKLPPLLVRYRKNVVDGIAPQCVTFRDLQITAEASVVDGQLVHQEHDDARWRAFVRWTEELQEDVKRERRLDRRWQKRWEDRGVYSPPPRPRRRPPRPRESWELDVPPWRR